MAVGWVSPPKLLSGVDKLGCRISVEPLHLVIGANKHLQRLNRVLGSVRGRGVAIQPTCAHVLEDYCVVRTFYVLLTVGVQVVGRNKIT